MGDSEGCCPSEAVKMDSGCLTLSVMLMSGAHHDVELDMSLYADQSVPAADLKVKIARMVTAKELFQSEFHGDGQKHFCGAWRIEIINESEDDGNIVFFRKRFISAV
jgi:hypothetical protein